MAIARMLKLRLVGLKSEQDKIMNELIECGAFEAAPTSVGGEKSTDRNRLDKAVAKQAKVSFAVKFIGDCTAEYYAERDAEEKKARRRGEKLTACALVERPPKKSGRRRMGYDDFYDVAAKEYELLSVCEELEKISFARLECKSELQKCANRLRAALPYAAFPSKFSLLGDTGSVSVSLWHSASRTLGEIFGDLPVVCEFYPCESGTLLSVISRKEDKEKVASVLVGAGFSSCPYNNDKTGAELVREYESEAQKVRERESAALVSALGYCKYLPDLQVLYDVIGREVEKASAESEFVTTSRAFVAEGWVPEKAADSVTEKIKRKTERVIIELTEPKEGDEPPTLVESKKIFKPYEDVTNMYSVPAYGEIDPNPFMAVFFFVFFGIMIGDAGYGLILALGGLIALKCLKPERGTARLVALIAMGGVSAILWGVLFGGVFAVESVPPLWFSPMQEPLMMLGVSIVLGAAQLLAGYALNSAKLFRAGKPLDAILDSIFIFVLFGGIACMALNLLLKPKAPLMEIGLGLLFASLAGILLTAGRHNKGVLSKIMGGFSGLYGLVNLLSDLLSYARIFGLGLASGAIGLAFNTLGELFFSIPVAGYVIGIIILIPLHAFNLGIGVLGAYVHNARLQFLEFYGKFYEGDGRLFSPMGEKTKYVRFD